MRSLHKYLSSKLNSRKKTDFIEELKECYNNINVTKIKDPTREILEEINKCKDQANRQKLKLYSELGREIPEFDWSIWNVNIAQHIQELERE